MRPLVTTWKCLRLFQATQILQENRAGLMSHLAKKWTGDCKAIKHPKCLQAASTALNWHQSALNQQSSHSNQHFQVVKISAWEWLENFKCNHVMISLHIICLTSPLSWLCISSSNLIIHDLSDQTLSLTYFITAYSIYFYLNLILFHDSYDYKATSPFCLNIFCTYLSLFLLN